MHYTLWHRRVEAIKVRDVIEPRAKYQPISLGSPGEDISKKDLFAVGQRFKNLHGLRFQQIQEFLYPRQRVFLDLLPLLFHQNHPMLPGFVGTDAPAGIPDYHPNRATILLARKFSKSFSYN